MITAKQVQELREISGAGMMDCKKVLVETNGNIEKASELLRERGITKAAKKSSRIAAEGLVDTYVSDDKKIGVVVEVNSETDFVSKNPEFKDFVSKTAEIIAIKNPKDVEELKKLEYENNKTVQEKLTDLIAKIGENMNIRRFVRIETDGILKAYIHGEGRIAVLVELVKGTEEVAQNICLQIAAMKPEFTFKSEVPKERAEKELEIYLEQVRNEGKPENIVEKIANSKVEKLFYGEVVLVNQVYVKDNSIKIEDYLKANNAEIKTFARLEKGEGLEKREENYAEEVSKQMNA